MKIIKKIIRTFEKDDGAITVLIYAALILGLFIAFIIDIATRF